MTDEQLIDEKKSESKKPKLDKKKLAKEAASMVAWDIVLALACKSGLHFSIATCLAADIVGDAGIIAYHNIRAKKSSDKQIEETKNTKDKQPKEALQNQVFNPLEFFLGVGLMAITLVLI